MSENARLVLYIKKSIADLREAENALLNMLDYTMHKKSRRDFTADEWENFILWCQLLNKLEYSSGKVQSNASRWLKCLPEKAGE